MNYIYIQNSSLKIASVERAQSVTGLGESGGGEVGGWGGGGWVLSCWTVKKDGVS